MPREDSEPLRPFPSTPWSEVNRAGQADPNARRGALSQLLVGYLPALKAHLVLAMRIPSDRADDLLQGFVSDKILGQGLIARADRERAKFRTFLLNALRNYVIRPG